MAIVAGSALSRRRVTGEAVQEAAGLALRAAGVRRASFAICFATSDHWDAAIGPALRDATGASAVIGCSGSGVLATDGVVEEGPGLALLVADGLAASVYAAPEVADDPSKAYAAIAPALASRGGAALVLAHPGGGFEPRMVTGLDAAGVQVIGGGAGGRSRVAVLAGETVLDGGFALARLPGLFAAADVAASARPVGRPMKITAAKGNHVFTLDGRPALEVLKESAAENGVALERAGAFLFAAVSLDPDGLSLARGRRLVRPLVGADAKTGALLVGERVQAGQAFTFCLREAVGARDELKEMLTAQHERLEGRRPAFGIYVDCASRGSTLYGDEGFDLAQLLRRFPGLPIVGFQSAFELGPAAGRTRLHLYTGALLLLAAPEATA